MSNDEHVRKEIDYSELVKFAFELEEEWLVSLHCSTVPKWFRLGVGVVLHFLRSAVLPWILSVSAQRHHLSFQ